MLTLVLALLLQAAPAAWTDSASFVTDAPTWYEPLTVNPQHVNSVYVTAGYAKEIQLTDHDGKILTRIDGTTGEVLEHIQAEPEAHHVVFTVGPPMESPFSYAVPVETPTAPEPSPYKFFVRGGELIKLVVGPLPVPKKEILYQILSNGDIFATVTIDGKDAWPGGHFLNDDEKKLYLTSREVLDKRFSDHAVELKSNSNPDKPTVVSQEKIEVTPTVEAKAKEVQDKIDAEKAK